LNNLFINYEKKIVLLALIITIIIVYQNISSTDSVSKQKSFDYFGQIPPGDSAKIFAPGVISDHY